MNYRLEHDLAKHLKSPELFRVYLLYGGQSYLVSTYRERIVKKALEGQFDAFNLHQFDMQSFDLQSIYDAVESAPMFSSGRCVVIDLELEKLDGAALQELCTVLQDPPNTTTIVVTVRDEQPKKDKLAKLLKVCDQAGAVAELGTRGRTDMLRMLRTRAQKNGCELSSEVASYLLERCGEDMQRLATETDKLCAYAGSGLLSRAQVDEIITPVLQARVFDLSRAILSGRHDQAMLLVDQLVYMREPVARVLAVLASAFTDLYRAYAASQAGVSASQAAEQLGYAKNRAFVVKKAMQDGAQFGGEALGKMLEALAEADLMVKSTRTDDRTILEQVITRLFLIAKA